MPAATPFNWILTPSTQASSSSAIHVPIPNALLGANALVVAVLHADTSVSFTVTDDAPGGSNTYATGPTGSDSGNGARIDTFVAPNTTAGARYLTLTPSAPCTYIQVFIAEIPGIALVSPLAGAGSAANATSGSWQPGSFTPSQANTLIVQIGWDVINGAASFRSSFTADTGNGFKLLAADTVSGVAVQYGQQGTAAAINPSLTTQSVGYLTVALALKLDAAVGTAPPATGIRIVGCQQTSVFGTVPQPLVTQFPSTGNFIVGLFLGFGHSGASSRIISAITDTKRNGYLLNQINQQSAIRAACQAFYSPSAKPDPNNILSVTFNANDHGSVLYLYDVANAPADPTDTFAILDGLQTGAAADLSTISISPSTRNGLVFVLADANVGTLRQMVGTLYQGDNPWTPEESGGENRLHDDAGFGHVYNVDTKTLTFVWTNNGGPVLDWNAVAICFRGQPTVTRRSGVPRTQRG